MVKLLYFASLREAVGVAMEDIALPAQVHDVASLRAHLAARGGKWDVLAHEKNLRTAVNQNMADDDVRVADGDEIAFFPPVTGG